MRLPEVGTLFQSKYRLDSILGAGGFATVFRATDVAADRPVAIKILTPGERGYSPEIQSRFSREVRVIANLRDPHTVTMFDFGRSDDGLLFMVFEHIPGEDLLELLERQGRLEPAAVVHILTQVLQSLREAHRAGLLHRDIKPANIRVYEYMGDPLRVKVLDFGIAKAVAGHLDPGGGITQQGELVGTPRYMSPEQLFSGELTAASDIYSLGVVAFEMLLGSTSMHGNRLSDQLQRLATGHVFSIPELERIGADLSRILDRMADRDVAKRFQTADQVLRALQHLEGSAPVVDHWSAEYEVDRTEAASSGAMLGGRAYTPPPSAVLTPRVVPPTQPFEPRTERAPRVPPPSANGGKRTALVAASLVLVGLVAIALGLTYVVVAGDETPTPTPVVPQHRSLAFIKGSDPPKTNAPEVVEDEPPDAGVEGGSAGCGKVPNFDGRVGDIRILDGLDVWEWPVYIPRNYDARRPYPLLMLLHENAETPKQFIDYSGFRSLADEEGFVIVAPFDRETPTLSWSDRSDLLIARRALLDLQAELCIDPRRIFAVGHGSGGRVIERIPCELPSVRAVATTSYRGARGDRVCKPEDPIPYLTLAPMHDGYNPIEGGKSCSGVEKISLRRKEEMWVERNHCAPKRRTYLKKGRNHCFTWDCGDTPFVSCHIDGGRGWNGTPPRPFDIHHCDGTPADFPYAPTIWKFFASTFD